MAGRSFDIARLLEQIAGVAGKVKRLLAIKQLRAAQSEVKARGASSALAKVDTACGTLVPLQSRTLPSFSASRSLLATR